MLYISVDHLLFVFLLIKHRKPSIFIVKLPATYLNTLLLIYKFIYLTPWKPNLTTNQGLSSYSKRPSTISPISIKKSTLSTQTSPRYLFSLSRNNNHKSIKPHRNIKHHWTLTRYSTWALYQTKCTRSTSKMGTLSSSNTTLTFLRILSKEISNIKSST